MKEERAVFVLVFVLAMARREAWGYVILVAWQRT